MPLAKKNSHRGSDFGDFMTKEEKDRKYFEDLLKDNPARQFGLNAQTLFNASLNINKKPTRRTYAIRNGALKEITNERREPVFYGRIKCDPPWTSPYK